MTDDAVREALAELEQAESHYRLTFQIAPSEAHLDIGRAWDRMKKAGDKARAALAQSEPAPVPDVQSAQAGVIQQAVDRVRNTLIVDGAPAEKLRETIAWCVADVGSPTAQATLRPLPDFKIAQAWSPNMYHFARAIERALTEANGMTLEPITSAASPNA